MSTGTPGAGVPPDPAPLYTYGPLVSAGNIRAAVLALLQDPVAGIVGYLTEVERLNGLSAGILGGPQLTVSHFRAGIDLETWESDLFPTYIVTVQPTGLPVREGGGMYAQNFEIRVGILVRATGQQDSIALADSHGIAVAACVGQHGGLVMNPDGTTLATRTMLTGYPSTELAAITGPRNIVRSVTTFSTYVEPVFAARYGPPLEQTPLAPGASVFPSVTGVAVTLSVEPLGSDDEIDPITTEIS